MAGQLRTGEAGRRGADVRSDCWIAVDLTDSGGVQLSLESKVGALFGSSIRNGILQTLAAFDIENAIVRLDDQGALPWVMCPRDPTAREATITRF